MCLNLLQDSHEAYDAAQEVCIKVWHKIGDYKGDAKFSTWLYRLITNQCLDLLRKNKRKKNDISLDGDEKQLLEQLNKPSYASQQPNEGEAAFEQKALQEVIHLGMQQLKPEYRVLLVLRDIEGYSYEEIALLLNLSLGTVKSRLSRARSALKRILCQNKEPFKSFFRHINKEEV